MVLLTQKIRRDPELKNYKLLFITDRGQLDIQFTKGRFRIRKVRRSITLNPYHLRELLEKDSSDIITSTIQKFQEDSTASSSPS